MSAAPPELAGAESRAWRIICAAARAIGSFDAARPARFCLGSESLLPVAPSAADYHLAWVPGEGWRSPTADEGAQPQRDLMALYLPVASGGPHAPITIGHLGQSLDGFIATASGDSCFVTGPENILHLHRLRALCDAVVIGAGTVDADDPQLTTRLVAGDNPARVILDPACRLPAEHTVFCDGEAVTLRVCAAGCANLADLGAGETLLQVAAPDGALDLAQLLTNLHERGYYRVLVEGGGVTVSSFLQAGLLDRLHIAIAPVLIGEGRPAIRLPARAKLRDCLRPRHRVYRSGGDILFDCELRALGEAKDMREDGDASLGAERVVAQDAAGSPGAWIAEID